MLNQSVYTNVCWPTEKELCFDDQFAFRPTGSTTAAVIVLLHTVRTMLSTDQNVHVFSFDFSKAFDTVTHEQWRNNGVAAASSDGGPTGGGPLTLGRQVY